MSEREARSGVRRWHRQLGVETQLVDYPLEGHSIEEHKHQIDLRNR